MQLFGIGDSVLPEAYQRFLLDRIEIPRVDYEKLVDKCNVEKPGDVCKCVLAARERKLLRFKGTELTCDAEIGAV